MEGSIFFNENNEGQFNEFKSKINEKASIYKGVIESFKSESALSEKFKSYQDEIDSEAFLCVTRVGELKSLIEKQNKNNKAILKKGVDGLFSPALKSMDIQLEITKISLDATPYDVMEEKHIEMQKRIENLSKFSNNNPEFKKEIDLLREEYTTALEDMFNAKDDQFHQLRDLFEKYKAEQTHSTTMGSGNSISNQIDQAEKSDSYFNSEIFKLIDGFEFNCREILHKAMEELNAERNNNN
ncbi:MAG: hypothetical protein KBC44_01590 [Candidatus Pacebacteria bacterium]|nr:hypothetical protein [Candidatus Paceibacterota bacterium]MBP9839656.1 hypothetical protein [Candidatus Paceibacterota bacterium]